MANKKEHFTKVPNDFIRGDIKTNYGVSRKFYIIYILIDRYRSYENYSWITVKKIFEFYGYKTLRKDSKAFREVLDVLEFMEANCMIEIYQDLNTITIDTGIEIKILSENFDYDHNFTKLTSSQLDAIMSFDSSANRENILITFLYVSSYIGCSQNDDSLKPAAFYKSLTQMAVELGMSKKTINQCLEYLTESNKTHNSLLIKREVKNIKQNNSQLPKSYPNIYVLNLPGYQQEIELAMKQITLFEI